jgi:hypothetical protein
MLTGIKRVSTALMMSLLIVAGAATAAAAQDIPQIFGPGPCTLDPDVVKMSVGGSLNGSATVRCTSPQDLLDLTVCIEVNIAGQWLLEEESCSNNPPQPYRESVKDGYGSTVCAPVFQTYRVYAEFTSFGGQYQGQDHGTASTFHCLPI